MEQLKGQNLKKDQGKTDWSLLPMAPIYWVVRVLMFGAQKYSRGGWQKGDYEEVRQRYYAAAYRHIVWRWWHCGENIDEESKLPHLAHGICCLVFLLWYDLQYRIADYLTEGLPDD